MAAPAIPATVAAAPPAAPRGFAVATAVMTAALAIAPFVGVYPVFADEGAVLRALRLRLQPAHRLRRPAVVRPRDVPRHRRLRLRARGEGVGPAARARDPRSARFAAALLGVVVGAARDPPAGHLLRDDHARARADDVLLLPAGAVHARRGRHPGGAARQAVRRPRPVATRSSCTTSCSRSSCAAFLFIYRIDPLAVRPGAQGHPARTSRARSRSATTPTATSSSRFVLSATLAGLAGATKAIVFQLASLTDVHWTMSGEVVLMTLLGGMGTIFGPVVGAFIVVGARELPRAVRRMGDDDHRRHLRRLRARVPPRHRRRARRLVGKASLRRDAAIRVRRLAGGHALRSRSPRRRPSSSAAAAATARPMAPTSCGCPTVAYASWGRSPRAGARARSSSGRQPARASRSFRTTTEIKAGTVALWYRPGAREGRPAAQVRNHVRRRRAARHQALVVPERQSAH